MYLAIEEFSQTLPFHEHYAIDPNHATNDYHAFEVPYYEKSSVLVVGLRYVFKETRKSLLSYELQEKLYRKHMLNYLFFQQRRKSSH